MKDIKPEFEQKRNQFLNDFKKQKRVNLIILIVTLVVLLILFIFLNDKAAIAVAVSFLAIIVLLVYTQFAKKKLSKRTSEYINDFYQITTDAALEHAELNDFILELQGEVSHAELESAQIVKDISFVRSRNVLNGTIHGYNARLADLLFKVKVSAKESKIAFCGKYIQVTLDKMYKEKVVMYLKPATAATGPNMLDDVHGVIEDERYVVYCSDDKFIEKHKALVKAFEEFAIDSNLLDATMTIVKDKMTFLLSYADNIMVVPLYEELNASGFSKFGDDLKNVKEIVGALKKVNKGKQKEEKVEEIEETEE